MWTFQYKHGDRPLEGYTIQRAAGRGGFGEVYYALSDSGREVALKVVTGYQDIELRGISQCMNLKSPHLVAIFDVKRNAEGKPFVIMEYVSGANLRQILDENPAGIGEQKAAFFLREIGKGLSYLHECGIVHRDLKPGNIFYENGYVKIGDYGLSKAISPTQHSGQTVTVGTVHYMAPEIGAGKYDRSIDIYALGAVLYEMLTGTPPYLGSSPSEILIKHLSSEPDCRNISEPFASVIKRAMHKDPAQRFQSVQEMVEAVFGAEHVRQSVSVFSPESLSMVAQRVAGKVAVPAGGGSGGSGRVGSSGPQPAEYRAQDRRARAGRGGEPAAEAGPDSSDMWEKLGSWVDDFGRQVGKNRLAGLMDAPSPPANDVLSRSNRATIAIAITALTALAAMLLVRGNWAQAVAQLVFCAVIPWSTALGALAACKFVLNRADQESPFVRKLIGGVFMSVPAALFSMPAWLAGGLGPTLLAVLLALSLFDVRHWLRPDRSERVDFWSFAFWSALLAAILAGMLDGSGKVAMLSAGSAALVMQLLAPWDRGRAAKRWRYDPVAEEYVERTPSEEPTAVGQGLPPPIPSASPTRITLAASFGRPEPEGGYAFVPAHGGFRFAWGIIGLLLLGAGIITTVATGMGLTNPNDFAPMLATGVALMPVGLFTLLQSARSRNYGLVNYVLLPVVRILCFGSIVASAVAMGNAKELRSDETVIGLIFIIMPALVLIGSLFLTGKRPRTELAADRQEPTAGASPFYRSWAVGLASVLFLLGVGGLHRFYVGKVASGIVWLLTVGLFGIGQIVDIILILTGHFTDADGRKVVRWTKKTALPPWTPIGPAAAGVSPAAAAIPGVGAAVAGASEAARAALRQIDELGLNRSANSRSAVGATARQVVGGVLSAVAALLVFGGVLFGLGAALDVPLMLASGLPNPSVRRDLDRLFNENPSQGYLVELESGMRLSPMPPDAPVPPGSRGLSPRGPGTLKLGPDGKVVTRTAGGHFVLIDSADLIRALEIAGRSDLSKGRSGRELADPEEIELALRELESRMKALQAGLEEIKARSEPWTRRVGFLASTGTLAFHTDPTVHDVELENPMQRDARKRVVRRDGGAPSWEQFGSAIARTFQSAAERGKREMEQRRVRAFAHTGALETATLGVAAEPERSWERLMKIGSIAAALALGGAGLLAMMLGRRFSGGVHMLRGLAGVGALAGMIVLVAVAFEARATWPAVAALNAAKQFPAMIESFVAGWSMPPAISAVVALVIGLTLLAWPSNSGRRGEVTGP
jgi:TM2 domain-containing membrane protein YozV